VNGFEGWLAVMPEEKKSLDPEISFLPPLRMVLTFFDTAFRKRDTQMKNDEEQKEMEEKNVEKLIEKLSEKEKK